MNNDPIADMLVMIRNACKARHYKVDLNLSKIRLEIAKVLKDEGLIKNFKLLTTEQFPMIRIYTKYINNYEPVISGLERVSKQSRRVYVKAKDIPRVLNGLGFVILSTSKGVMTGKKAKKTFNVGGEILCRVW